MKIYKSIQGKIKLKMIKYTYLIINLVDNEYWKYIENVDYVINKRRYIAISDMDIKYIKQLRIL